jgi:acyl-CoA thioester hydrolase
MNPITLRVRYRETDQSGRVYHANYFDWYDQARTEYLRQNGFSYKKLEEAGCFLVVAEANNKYYKPIFFDDLIEVRVELALLKKASMEFNYFITNKETGELLSEGYTKLGMVDKFGKIIKIPAEIISKLK